MEFRVFRIRRRKSGSNSTVGLKLFPSGERHPARDDEESLEVLANAILKGKCEISVSNDILIIDFLYDGSGTSIKFFAHNKNFLKEVLESPLPPRIELKRKYDPSLHGDKLEESAMIVYLKKTDHQILFE